MRSSHSSTNVVLLLTCAVFASAVADGYDLPFYELRPANMMRRMVRNHWQCAGAFGCSRSFSPMFDGMVTGIQRMFAVQRTDRRGSQKHHGSINQLLRQNAAVERKVFREVASVAEGGSPGKPGSVLYLVKTWSGNYDTKLRAVMKTWGGDVDKASLLVVGDKPSEEFPIHVASECGSDATQGLSCRVAHSVELASQTSGNWSWVFIVDDDHYVVPANVENALAKFDSNDAVGLGCYGCGRDYGYCSGKGGFCGGCGYGFSKTAVQKMMQGSSEGFRRLHKEISHSPKSDGREDMAMSCVALERIPDLKIVQLGGLEGSSPDANEMNNLRLKGSCSDHLLWHAIKPEAMPQLHDLVTKPEGNCTSPLST